MLQLKPGNGQLSKAIETKPVLAPNASLARSDKLLTPLHCAYGEERGASSVDSSSVQRKLDYNAQTASWKQNLVYLPSLPVTLDESISQGYQNGSSIVFPLHYQPNIGIQWRKPGFRSFLGPPSPKKGNLGKLCLDAICKALFPASTTCAFEPHHGSRVSVQEDFKG